MCVWGGGGYKQIQMASTVTAKMCVCVCGDDKLKQIGSTITDKMCVGGNDKQIEMGYTIIVKMCVYTQKRVSQTNVILQYKLQAAILSAVCSVIKQS